eukprot:7752076-Heterocapsa_arctica.AAC.1
MQSAGARAASFCTLRSHAHAAEPSERERRVVRCCIIKYNTVYANIPSYYTISWDVLLWAAAPSWPPQR